MSLPGGTSPDQLRHQLNRINIATYDAKLGDIIVAQIAAYNDLSAKYAALLAKLDAANLAGMGSNNVATLSPAAANATLPLLGSR